MLSSRGFPGGDGKVGGFKWCVVLVVVVRRSLRSCGTGPDRSPRGRKVEAHATRKRRVKLTILADEEVEYWQDLTVVGHQGLPRDKDSPGRSKVHVPSNPEQRRWTCRDEEGGVSTPVGHAAWPPSFLSASAW